MFVGFACVLLGLSWRTARADHTNSAYEPIHDLIHHTADYVPPFPMVDRQFLKARDWPDTLIIGGVRTVRRIHASGGDRIVALRSLKDVNPGQRVTLFYDVPETHWSEARAGWGPRYSWSARGRLEERIWYEPDSSRLVTRDYTYYKSGRLLGYSWRSEPRNQQGSDFAYEYLSEFFDTDGQLIAVAHEKKDPSGEVSLFAWKGEAVTFDEFRMKTHVLYAGSR